MKKITTFKSITILLLLVTRTPNLLPAQFMQQGSKLAGTGAAGDAYQGVSVSISSDGNTAIAGGSGDNNSKGAAWVYTRSGGVWSQQGNKLVGTGAIGKYGPYQGSSIAISADGNTAIVGGVGDNTFAGAAWIFTRNGGVWTQQGNKLVGTGGVGNSSQGESVSISGDGNTAAVGGYDDNGGVGAVWVYTRTGGVWHQQGNKLVGTGNIGQGAGQGRSLALSSNGNTLITGGPGYGGEYNTIGAAWVFTRTGGVWTQQGKLVGTGAINKNGTYQGTSVSISSDGNTAIVGGWKDNNGIGAAWIFTRAGSAWTQQGSKLTGMGAAGMVPQQGLSVSISADGNKAIVGGRGDNGGKGAVWVYTRTGGAWTQQGNKLVGTGSVGNSNQGTAVCISSDGSTAIVGGPEDNSGTGAVWMFQSTPASYCSSKGTNTTHGFINKVSMETISNTSGNNGGYANFTSQSATLQRGATYTIGLTPGFVNGAAFFEYWTVYIDYNENGVFEPDEIVARGHNAIRINKSFTVPVNILNSATRMRIQMQADSFETNPCGIYAYGEVEDYTVVITGNKPGIAQANPDVENTAAENAVSFRLYPNPAKDHLTVEFKAAIDGYVKVNVYNPPGQKLINIISPSVKGSNSLQLNIDKLSPGFYILEIENNGLIQREKFLISR